MLKTLYFLLACWVVDNSSFAAINLHDAYIAALKRSEIIASQDRQVQIAEERYSQARGNILPSLSFNASYTLQDRPTDPLATAFFPREQTEAKLTARQPLFRGLREFAALNQSHHLMDAEGFAKENAARLLYNDVAKSYHAVLAAEENLHNISDQLKLYDERIEELSKRVRSGTSSETDLLALQSSRASVQSQYENAKANVSSAREVFAFFTAYSSTVQLTPISVSQTAPKAIEEYLKGIEKRPDILDLVERSEAADSQVTVAKGAHAPTIDLFGNYYFKRQSDVYKGIDWDVQAALSFPIFSGGTTVAQVSEAVLQREKAELELARQRRQTIQQIRILHSDYVSGLESIAALEKSLQLAEKNYQLLNRDFHRGLARNLDVLQALISAHEIRRELLKARFIARDKWVELHIASGLPITNKGI